MQAHPVAVGLALTLLFLAGCGSAEVPDASAEDPVLETVLRLDFEAAGLPLGEGDQLAGAAGTRVTAVVHLSGPSAEPITVVDGKRGAGRALKFPAPCDATHGPACPRAILEVADDGLLDPRGDDFAFGASVLLDPTETSAGSNVVQKGFARGGGSQWKLQVDGLAGHPSCVVVGMGDEVVHRARGSETVADGSWHEISCRRAGNRLAITVDGTEQSTTRLPPGLEISPPGPVRLAGKSLKPNNDQFFGTLDGIFYARPA